MRDEQTVEVIYDMNILTTVGLKLSCQISESNLKDFEADINKKKFVNLHDYIVKPGDKSKIIGMAWIVTIDLNVHSNIATPDNKIIEP